jgi:hypothetical protein
MISDFRFEWDENTEFRSFFLMGVANWFWRANSGQNIDCFLSMLLLKALSLP